MADLAPTSTPCPAAAGTWRTRLTALFGMRVPILGGGLMWLSDAHYVAALARAGAMAFLTPRSFESAAEVERQIQACRAAAGDAPFGVNLTLSRRADANVDVDRHLAVALDQGVRHFETVGAVTPALFDRIHAAGGVVVHKCAWVEHAVKAEARGADAVALVGPEAGGHPGMNELPAFLLAALALPRLKGPLAVGGGIGSGRQIAAALALGCDGVLIGTRFLVGAEVQAHARYQQRLVDAGAEDSVMLLRSTGHPWRVLNNANARDVAALEAGGACRYEDFGPRVLGRTGRDGAYRGGDPEQGLLSMGPAVAFADRVQPLGEIVDTLMAEATTALQRLPALLPTSTATPTTATTTPIPCEERIA